MPKATYQATRHMELRSNISSAVAHIERFYCVIINDLGYFYISITKGRLVNRPFVIFMIILCYFRYIPKFFAYVFISIFTMRNKTIRTAFDFIIYIFKISSAFISKRIKRTKTKHTVKILPCIFVTGEIFTFGVFIIIVIILHFTPQKAMEL